MHQSNSSRCSRCVMDTTDPDIQFDERGICNHCSEFLYQRDMLPRDQAREDYLQMMLADIKSRSSKSDYDCVIGVSGGTDSTYLAYIVREHGLRPLAVHVDNGWNSELAVSNIEKVLRNLDIDLVTHVIDWLEFKDLQVSFLKASTPDSEVPTDHAIRAVLYRVAAEHNIEFIINGRNFSTEGILPWSWTYSALDWKYISGIQIRALD